MLLKSAMRTTRSQPAGWRRKKDRDEEEDGVGSAGKVGGMPAHIISQVAQPTVGSSLHLSCWTSERTCGDQQQCLQ